MKTKWLDRNLIQNPLYFCLCTSPAILKSELKKMKCDAEINIPIGKSATTNFLKNERNETVVIVCLYDHSTDLEQIHALLVHEAIHIWQEIKDILGEKNPSHEFEAYSIQQISQQMFYEYKRQKPRKKRLA